MYEGERFLAETVVEGKWWYATIELPGDIGEAKDYQLTAKVIDGDQESRTAPVKVSYRPDMVSMTDAHVTAGWNRDMTINEKTGVIATAIAEFTPIEVSVTFDGEVEEAFIHFIGQTVSLTKEDNQFVGTFPSGWTSFGEQLFEVSYIVNGETIRVPLMEVLVLIDPSGYVFEGSMENRLEGATAILEVWLEDEERWSFYDTTLINQINPQTTDVNGRYGWDVPKGDWRVVFSKDDYARYESRRVVVPPAETELNVPLTRTTDPVVDTIDFGTLETNPHDASVITITFDRLMDVASLKEAIELKLGEQTLAIDYDYHSLPGYKEVEGQSGYYETDESIELTDEITIQLKEDSFTPGETYDVVISTLASDYDGKTLTEYVYDSVTIQDNEDDEVIDPENPGDDTNQTPESGTDSEDAGSEEQLSADDDQDGAIDDSNEATGNQDGSSDLPNTSTNTYQLLLMGALFILFGTGSVVLYRKKRA